MVYASAIQVRYKPGDFPSQGLSAGAKGGIAVGAIFAVLISLLVWFFLSRTKRRATHGPEGAAYENPAVQGGMSELPGQENKDLLYSTSRSSGPLSGATSELDGSTIHYGGLAPVEMDNTSRPPVHEIYGTPVPAAELRDSPAVRRKPVGSSSPRPGNGSEGTTSPFGSPARSSAPAPAPGTSSPTLAKPHPAGETPIFPLVQQQEPPAQSGNYVSGSGEPSRVQATSEDPTSLHAEGAPVDEEWEWIREQEARLLERKKRNLELQRLKEEEDRIAREEEELRELRRAKKP